MKAGEQARTVYLHDGNVALYQMSYTRVKCELIHYQASKSKSIFSSKSSSGRRR